MDLGLTYKFITASVLKSTWSLAMILIFKCSLDFCILLYYMSCLCVCTCNTVWNSWRPEEGIGPPEDEGTDGCEPLWVLRTEPRPSAGAAHTLHHWVFSPEPWQIFMTWVGSLTKSSRAIMEVHLGSANRMEAGDRPTFGNIFKP